MLTQP
ncbi:hypothetical protein IEO21_10693 [Rhodonia placenta]|jgi:4-hydroxybenzoate polyprenyltransferase